ncbi:MAG TPA: alkaline phosphatase family protein [Candidatus Baltobacteraceae bacterium]|nr:alkaline phosphatase family protein [Candidatus Baltobacteraceae bacterium]
MKRFATAAAIVATAVILTTTVPQAGRNDSLVQALRRHVKHVFIIYQENHTFDNYFGSYPGAENLTTPLARAHGFRQYDPIGKQWVTPFRITDPDTAGPSQARPVIEGKMDGGAMDRFVSVQEQKAAEDYALPADRQAVGLLTMSFYDCDTIPYLWKYAKTFTLFDRVFQGMAGPSTPGNIEIIAAQAGQSQGHPIYDDRDPDFGPYDDNKAPKRTQIDQRYATLMLSLAGNTGVDATKDIGGVRDDIAAVARLGRNSIPWGWYQEGYNGSDAPVSAGYESHHNAPQYFGYLRQNAMFWKNERPVKALLAQLRDGTLPPDGIFYLKGASRNSFGWKPRDRDPIVQANTLGDDDHPGVGDSDHEAGEAFVATFVNAIARSRYWNDSVIIITWDDAGGYYDHVPPPQFERCTDGKPCGDGPRVPLILISPYAKSGVVVHDAGDTASVVKFAETLFGTPPLASLPDERRHLPQGPRDTNAALTDLLGAFDQQRLRDLRAPIPPSAALLPDTVVNRIPTPMDCRSLAITPAAVPGAAKAPHGFRARPSKPHV